MFSPFVSAFGVSFLFGSEATNYFRSSEVMVYVPCGCLYIRGIAKQCSCLLQTCIYFRFYTVQLLYYKNAVRFVSYNFFNLSGHVVLCDSKQKTKNALLTQL